MNSPTPILWKEPAPQAQPSSGILKQLRHLALFLVVAACVVAFLMVTLGSVFVLLGPKAVGSRDFVEYWAAGQQLMHGANPYDPDAILRLELGVGFPDGLPAQVMANPPTTLMLVMPLGLLGPKAGVLSWVFLLLLSLAASVEMIRRMVGQPKNLLHLLGYAFAPAWSCVLAGQVTIFILLGLVLFLRLHKTRPFWAGVSLWLCLLKPHLFLPFGVVLICWVVVNRSYRIVVGCAAAIAVSSALATLVNPHIWSQYAGMMSSARVDRLPLPCVSVLLRQWIYPHTLSVQCMPAALACAWALAWYVKRRKDWSWIENGSLLMVVSVLVAPYSWFMDQAVLLPALLYGAYRTRSEPLICALALISAGIEFGELSGVKIYSPFYLWTAPAWLLWYLLTLRTRRGKGAPAAAI